MSLSIKLCRKTKLLNRCNRKPPTPREGDRTGFSNDAKHRLRFSDCGGRSFHALANYYKKVSCCWVNSFRHLLRLKLRKCHLPREGGLSYFFDSLKTSRRDVFRAWTFGVFAQAQRARIRKTRSFLLAPPLRFPSPPIL